MKYFSASTTRVAAFLYQNSLWSEIPSNDMQRTRLRWIGLAMLVVLLAFCCDGLWARPTTPAEAERLVVGWLKADPQPLGTSLGRQVRQVETFTNTTGEVIYHIVYLQPSGFVILSADDLVEPIVGFVRGDRFDPSPDNPLGALVVDDLKGRIAAVRTESGLRIMAEEPSDSQTQTKWRHFMDLADARRDKKTISILASSVPSMSDVRVAPLVRSKWHQISVCGSPCYNYYTPNNSVCGCPATAMAQLMRFHEYPTAGIGVHGFTITLGWPTGPAQQAFTRGGDGAGGPYHWDLMAYEPSCATTPTQRQAIGALCYDAGVAMNQMYSANTSGWIGCTNARMTNALKTTFAYANAVHGYTGESPIGGGLIGMINPNLDAKKPVVLGTIEHAFVCDGYGYNERTLYHHLNMGWSGQDDAWYDLNTSIGTRVGIGPVCSCVYNVQTLRAGDGEIVSGRVLDHNGEPMAGVVLHLMAEGEILGATETDSEGIYAFDYLQSNTAYTLDAVLRGYGFNSQEVITGISQDNAIVSGNVWNVDFVGLFCDFNSDQKVDGNDLTMLMEHWGQADPAFDIAPVPLGDGIVDDRDQEVLMAHWGLQVDIPEIGLAARWKLDESEGMIAQDSVGTNDATVVGTPLWRPEGGKVGGALELSGAANFARTSFARDPSQASLSVFAWVKGGAPGQVIVSQAGGANWLTIAPTGALMTELKSAGRFGKSLISQVVVTDGQWHRVGLTWDGSNRVLYVDDVEAARDTQSGVAGSVGGLYLGAGSTLTPASFWKGLTDDVRIYNRAVKP
jgi:hypothetical protein